MNNNHPSRNWRAHMRQAADQWMASSDARLLMRANWLGELSTRIQIAFLAGYEAGRKSKEQKP